MTFTCLITEKARDNFVDEKNTQFDYSMFHYKKGFELNIVQFVSKQT